jgi:hypothetical protein
MEAVKIVEARSRSIFISSMATPPVSRGEYLTAVATAVTQTKKIEIGLNSFI